MAFRNYILVCGGSGCESSHSDQIYQSLVDESKAQGVADAVQIVKTGCFGFCEQGPIVKILPEEAFYVHVKPEDAKELISEHIIKGREVKRLLYDKSQSQAHAKVEDIKFYQKQFRIVLRNCGFINPENIDEYIARDGFKGLEKALFSMTPDDIINEMKISGLRGRGGAGFPTWMKWNFTKQAPGDVKYVVCNADEGDPGAYMDRSTLEGDPNSVLEAMIICGKAIGAHQGYIYIRAEYPLAIHRLEVAMKQCHEYGLLGKDILGSGFDFDIEIRLGAGAFVCGEETALLQSIMGKRGMPQPRPPFPATKGLWGKPTVINNVETWANVPVIIDKGGAWFAKIGTADSKGTKVFAVTGKIANSGLVEVPMGTTLREIIFDIGGGIAHGKKFKGVQTGGPSGGVITEEYLDTPIDYGALTKLGSIMGSGGMIVMDEDDCMVDVAKFYLGFTVDESCGKCAPCRIGGKSILALMEKITNGAGTMDDVEAIKTIGHAMQRGSLCALGQTSPNPVLSTMKNFPEEYRAHIIDKKCPAGKCKKLITYVINPDKCIGCGACSRKCPVGAIAGAVREKHVIDPKVCIRCGACRETCKFGAILVK
ncbi:MAG: NADH-quinone oxidoreductase subunit NuoF [Sphaerochaeta sp.]|jgi:NADH:ubiquinone oxidoreductase subunit F (NADH-binding)/(2Fe-2S) ferredoxin|nr:NADH-quinone oxidoreductase subunit NuoF [Sphaerochaeta sp.]MCH3919040.1 NADH-quinone oxidoreductase subunit NuoF [Sphaerochaeta sp.]MCI2044884.1 NADH-quinone oxidoreductase subunit NuoF [Sphaerochaeta sp.]MCI2075809.1 NADH-quinone oxidoreductase subunit NuoF [Sphaerochaeta sp.]MCI2096418.1 NADH-quinone oxidoreductase subunit NuoF [Sphaerochaeta sp.]